MVATYACTRLTYSPLVSPAGSVGCRLTTCVVSRPIRREVTDLPPWSMSTTLLGAARSMSLLGSKTSTLRRAFAGDFQVRHRLWDATAIHSGGLHLADAISDSNLTLLLETLSRGGGGCEGEFYDPVASAFRVKLVRNDVLGDCRFRSLRRGGGGGGGGGGSRRQVSHSGIFTLFVGAFCHFICRSDLCHLFVH